MNIAILSNVNVEPVISLLDKKCTVFHNEGYGNIFEMLLDQDSSYNKGNIDITFILIDIADMIKECTGADEAFKVIDEWFETLSLSLKENKLYFVSDVDYRAVPMWVTQQGQNRVLQIENYWYEQLKKMTISYSNIFIFEYQKLVRKTGRENFYSSKFWYMGKIPYTSKAQKVIVEEIEKVLNLCKREPKKVLLLDLDNTLWGNVVGEEGINGINLSEDNIGAIYKDFQRTIKMIKDTGILLGIVSKNNEKDAMEVIKNHKHMYLKEEDFIIKKINWQPKYLNIIEIAKELNLGLNSFVFIDDNPAERELVASFLKEVTVPEFPKNIEHLSEFAWEIYEKYFKKLRLTDEDKHKTQQYVAEFKRNDIKKQMLSFSDYVKALNIKIACIKDAKDHIQRLHELIQKTNQFNLTGIRYDRAQIMNIVSDNAYKVYLFKAEDKFGDYGIISSVIVSVKDNIPIIELFVMSCRVMGRMIENYIIDYVEKDLKNSGYEEVIAKYIKTEKNKPVQDFYDKLGYVVTEKHEKELRYRLHLNACPKREYYIQEEEINGGR